MADWNSPTLTSLYADMVSMLKDRDLDVAKQFSGVTVTNPQEGMIRWSDSGKFWEKRSGVAWVALATKYGINVEQVDGCDVSDASSPSTSVLWTSQKITNTLAGFYTKAEIDDLKNNYVTKNGDLTSLTIGTNDASSVNLETNNITRLSVGGSGNIVVTQPTTGNTFNIASAPGFDAINATGPIGGTIIKAYAPQGTAPLTVVSTTKVTNLNADKLNGLTWSVATASDTIVARDVNGNFSANQITANLNGIAAKATKLETARTINGNLFDGSQDIELTKKISGTIPAIGSTTEIGVPGTPHKMELYSSTGVSITSFGTAPAGTTRELSLKGNLTIVHSNNIYVEGTYANITTDINGGTQIIAIAQPTGTWKVYPGVYDKLSPMKQKYLSSVTEDLATSLSGKADVQNPVVIGAADTKGTFNTIDLTTGSYFNIPVNGNVTIPTPVVPSDPTGNAIFSFIVYFNPGSYSITWFPGISWIGETTPLLKPNKTNFISFFGSAGSWTGLHLGNTSNV